MDVGPWELAIVAIVALLMFGSKRLPELAQGIGEAKREYQRGLTEGLDGPDEARPATSTSSTSAEA